MNFDFDRVIDRRGTNSFKWNVPEGQLPLWVADMDFETAPAIREAVQKIAACGIYGYAGLPDSWAAAYVTWWKTRHGFETQPEWYVFASGVIPALSSVIRKLSTPAEQVAVLTPAYNHFFTSIENNGRIALESRLLYRDGAFSIDWDDLEAKLADPQTSLLLLCNPQNPTGQIWDRETLSRIGEAAVQNGVTVLSDEIHCDLTDPGTQYVPFASVSELCRDHSVSFMAPTKTFGIPGLHTSAVMAADPFLRHRVWRALNTDEVAEPNVFSVDAAVAAYEKGAEWLDAVRAYIFENKKRVRSFIETRLPELAVVPSEATYLLWIDAGKLPAAPLFEKYLREQAGLLLSPGAIFRGGGETFLRMNTACPRAIIEEALQRLEKGVEGWKALHR